MVEQTEPASASPTPSNGSVETIELKKCNGEPRVFVHQLNLSSADVLRRQRDREMVAQEMSRLKLVKKDHQRQQEEEKRQNMEMLVRYNPWNKPGAGAPMENSKRTKFTEEQLDKNDQSDNNVLGNTLTGFGKPGAGAPQRTKSGRMKTQLSGDPEIRFQDAQKVRLSIENQLRYKNPDKDNPINSQESRKQRQLAKKKRQMQLEDTEFQPWGKGFGNPERDEKGNVRRHKFSNSVQHGVMESRPPSQELGVALPLSNRGGNGAPQVTLSGNPKTRLRSTLEVVGTSGHFVGDDGSTTCDEKENYNPWGKPGAGAPLKDSRWTGKDFMEKMGWSMSGNPKKRSQESKRNYLKVLLQETEEKKNRDRMEKSN
ncbi:uncharacterized protein LOC143238021 isoform X1 [Tachypleus tridentatus]|uniref:uncharacterized protein LOC143238021 isoform X1 n=1 Tax=Tachypleus tridentatus TaxID=6853 RepID=UPI003FCEE857